MTVAALKLGLQLVDPSPKAKSNKHNRNTSRGSRLSIHNARSGRINMHVPPNHTLMFTTYKQKISFALGNNVHCPFTRNLILRSRHKKALNLTILMPIATEFKVVGCNPNAEFWRFTKLESSYCSVDVMWC